MITRRSMFGLALVPWAPKPAAPTLVAEFIRLATQQFPEEFMQPLPLPKGITRLDVQRAFDIIEAFVNGKEWVSQPDAIAAVLALTDSE